MGKSYKGNSEYGRKFRDFRNSKKSKNKNKNNDRRIRQLNEPDDTWMRFSQWEN